MDKYIKESELFKRILNVDFKHDYDGCIKFCQSIPAADVVEVVRCRDCVMWDGSFMLNGQKKCLNMTFCTDGDFYCGWGTKNE